MARARSGAGFHTFTLGCKLNQFDGAALEAELSRRGFLPEPDPSRAAVVIVNTCTVTAAADREARRLIRRLRRENPGCTLLVTGCYAERDPGELLDVGAADRIFGNRAKPDFRRVLDEMGIGPPAAAAPAERADGGCDGGAALPPAVRFGDRSRAFLKIQEGCDLACSYCVIPEVRGPSRSVRPTEVESALLALVEAGYREIVLTGVNTGDYGRDLRPPTCLARLLERLLGRCGANRIRLNSLEPLAVTDEIVDLMASDPRLAPHLQVPLQSGCDRILRRMRRNYRLSTYLARLRRVRSRVPHAGLGADVIVGFPGETERDFEQTLRVIAESPLTYLHVFAWSARPLTAAAAFEGAVPAGLTRERSARLRALGENLSERFRKGFEGAVLDAVVLGPRGTGGALRALTGNFIEVTLDPSSAAPSDLIAVRVTRSAPTETRGIVVGRPPWAPAAASRRPSGLAPIPLAR